MREQRNIEKIVKEEERETRKAKSKEKQRKREKEKYLSLPEIPGMNGGINSPRGGGKLLDGMQRIYAVKASDRPCNKCDIPNKRYRQWSDRFKTGFIEELDPLSSLDLM